MTYANNDYSEEEDDSMQTEIRLNNRTALKCNEPNPANAFFGKNSKFYGGSDEFGFYQENQNNEMSYKGIKVINYKYEKTISIGYWKNGQFAPGSYIDIDWGGETENIELRVGEKYMKDGLGRLYWRGTKFWFVPDPSDPSKYQSDFSD